MAFWSEQTMDPKRKFRWVVNIPGLDGIGEYVAKTIKKPNFKVGESPVKFINHTFYYPGRVEWETVDITLYDPGGDDDVTKALIRMLQRSGYSFPDDIEAAKNSITKGKATGALGLIELSQLDGDGGPVETWVLQNAWLQNVNFGDLSYDDDNVVEITLTVRYDWAEITR